MKFESLRIDLSNIELQDIEVLAQDGARELPDFAASTEQCESNCCGTSTSTGDEVEEEV